MVLCFRRDGWRLLDWTCGIDEWDLCVRDGWEVLIYDRDYDG